MPRQQNLFLPDVDNAELAPLYALAHWSIENGLKAILLLEDDQYDSRKDRHDLTKLLQRLEGSNSEDANYFITAFDDTVCIYTIDKRRWQHFLSLDAYLEENGRGDLHETFRYWALPKGELGHIPLIVHRELIIALEKLLGWRHKQITSIRLEEWIRAKLSKEVLGHTQCRKTCMTDRPHLYTEFLNDSHPSDTPFREKLQPLYNQHA